MDFNTYQEQAMSTRTENTVKIVYPVLGLVGEAGEVANKVKKVIRDNGGKVTSEMQASLGFELGDILWYISALADDLGLTLEAIAEANLYKLASRKERDAIKGDGDNR